MEVGEEGEGVLIWVEPGFYCSSGLYILICPLHIDKDSKLWWTIAEMMSQALGAFL